VSAAEDGNDTLSYLPAHTDKSRAVDLTSLHIGDIIAAILCYFLYNRVALLKSSDPFTL
jgi:hypothetical protein